MGLKEYRNHLWLTLHYGIENILSKLSFRLSRGSDLASSLGSREFEHRSFQKNDFKICICFIFTSRATFGVREKDWSARSHKNNVSWYGVITAIDCYLVNYHITSTNAKIMLISV